jgi:signal transduction histidine kinase
MRRLFVCMLCCLPLWAPAQTTSKLDSMVHLFETGPKDATALPVLRAICAEHPNSIGRLLYAKEMLNLAESFEVSEYIHYAYMQVGIAYRIQGNLAESSRNLFLALDYAQEIGDIKKIGESYGEISTSFASQGDTKNAVNYINRAIDIFRQQNDSLNLCIALFNTGYDYHTMGKTDSALLYYAEAESIALNSDLKNEDKKSFLAYIRGNRGITQGAIGLHEEAVKSIRETLIVLESLGDRQAIVDYEYHLAKILHGAGRTEEAMTLAKQTLLESSVLNIKATMRDASLLIYRMYLSKQDYKSALKYRLTHEAIKDSIQNANVIREMANQQTAFEVGLKQAEVDLLDVQKQNQAIINTGLGTVLVIVIIAAILIYQNYRDKTELNVKLEKKSNQLETINQTKDKLFSIISHDLRGPVTAFSGLARVVRFYVMTDKKDELLELAGHMQDSASKLNSMLENLLVWSIQEQGELELNPEPILLQKLTDDLCSTYQAMLDEKQIRLVIQCETSIQVYADWNTLHAAIRNLISNAIKFTPEKGEIGLCCRQEAEAIVIEVSDTGVGIPKEKINGIFDLSTSTKNTFGTNGEKGLGLGLKIVHEFVSLNKGTIEVFSETSKGTTFTIRLQSAPQENKLTA